MANGGPGVVIVESGGLPVTQVAGGGNASPFTVVTGNGFPVTLVDTLGIAVALYNLDGTEYSGFSLDAPVVTWISDAATAQAIFEIDVDAGVVSGDKIWGESSTDNFATVLETVSAAIGAPDLADFQIDDFAFSPFTPDGTYYARFWVSNSADVAISPKSDVISETILTVPGPPTLSYEANASAANSGSTTTATGVSIGTELATRRVIVAIASHAVNGRTLSSATIAGVAATLHGSPSTQGGNHNIEFISAIVPTGATGDIILTWSSTRFNGDHVFVFTVDDDDLTSPTPVLANASTAGGTSMTNSVNVSEGGFVIMAASWNNGTPKSQAGSGDTAVTNVALSNNFIVSYSGSNLSADPDWDGTISWNGSYASAMQIATWR